MLDTKRLEEVFEIDDSVVSALPADVGVTSTDRLNAWTELIGGVGQFGVEYLVPRVRQKISGTWPSWVQRRRSDLDVSADDLRAEVKRLRPWEVPFSFGDGIDAIENVEVARGAEHRMLYRRDLICDTITTLLGSGAGERSVLDIGCNCGFFSLDLAAQGVGHVHGVDLRPHHVAQAEFLAEHFGVANVDFEVRDVDAVDHGEQCDVVLNAGLLYHVVNPLQFLQHTFELCREFAVIDTVVHREPMSGYFLVGGMDVQKPGEGRESWELRPTYRGVIDTIRYAGFRDVIEVVGVSEDPHELYRKGARRCFIALK